MRDEKPREPNPEVIAPFFAQHGNRTRRGWSRAQQKFGATEAQLAEGWRIFRVQERERVAAEEEASQRLHAWARARGLTRLTGARTVTREGIYPAWLGAVPEALQGAIAAGEQDASEIMRIVQTMTDVPWDRCKAAIDAD